MIVAIIGILAGGLGLTALIDNMVGTDFSTSFVTSVWGVLQYLISPIISLFSLIWDKLTEFVQSFFSL